MGKKMGPSAKDPLQKVKSNSGTIDFSGQDTWFPSANPAAEVASNHDGGTAGVSSVSLPGERGTRKLKVIDGADIEQLLGTRR